MNACPDTTAAARHVSFFCHTLGLSLVPQQILHYFQLVISVWQDFKLRFILGSSPENRNALGSAVVDNLCQGRPRLKYGSFFFLLPWRSHSLWRIATWKKKKKEREKKRLCIDWEALVCFMNDDIEYDAPDKTSHTFHQKSQTEKKKKEKRNVHLSSAYNLTAKPCSRHAHHLFIHLVHSCLCI